MLKYDFVVYTLQKILDAVILHLIYLSVKINVTTFSQSLNI